MNYKIDDEKDTFYLELLRSIREKIEKAREELSKEKLERRHMTFYEAADYLGYRDSYLYKLTCHRKIPFRKPGGKLLFFFKDELDEWKSKRRKRGRRAAVVRSK